MYIEKRIDQETGSFDLKIATLISDNVSSSFKSYASKEISDVTRKKYFVMKDK